MQVIHLLASFAWNTNNIPIHQALVGFLKTTAKVTKAACTPRQKLS